jgi:mannose-1-phosphate guanylyltransferase/mannose-6-phosphate isomerase
VGNKEPIILIMCGGRSLRLFPLSEYRSKNFLDIFGFSPLELTIKRFLKITSRDNIFLVANTAEKKELSKIKLIKKSNIFFEPQSKNTAAAVILSLCYLKKRFSLERNLIISPVDHLIKQEKQFYSALQRALRAAEGGSICTVGIKPRKPSVNFGYIQADKEVNRGIFSVKRFIEKPSLKRAEKLIAAGDAFYNSGMFITSLSTLDEEYRNYYPYYNNFCNVFERRTISQTKVNLLYNKIKDIPFDKAIMEKTKKVRLVKGEFFWKDFGNWEAVYEVLPKDKAGNVKKGNAFIHEGENNFIYLDNLKKKALVIGLENIVFIDTPKYVLVTNRAYLDSLKPAVKELKKLK